MFPLRVETLVRVRRVVDNVELAVLVVVSVPPVDHSVVVPLLVPELPVVPVVRVMMSLDSSQVYQVPSVGKIF